MTSSVSSGGASRWKLLSLVVLTGCGYYAAGRLGLALAIPPGYATVVWPPAGIALAAVLCGGPETLLGVALGSFLVNLIGHLDASSPAALMESLLLPLGIALAAVLQASAGAFVIRRFRAYPMGAATPASVGLFFLLGGLLSCMVAASSASLMLLAAGKIALGDILTTWAIWWAGDVVGVVVFAPLLLTLATAPKGERWRRAGPVAVTALASFAATVLLVFLEIESDQRAQRSAFLALSSEFAGRIASTVDLGEHAVDGLSGFFLTPQERTLDDFKALADRLAAFGLGIQALEWAPRIPAGEKASAEAALAAEWKQPFTIFERREGAKQPPAARADYFPVGYVTPLAGNEGAVGFDLGSNPARLDALSRARDSGAPVASAGVRLVQNNAMGILVFVPVYSGAPADVASRRAALKGFAIGVFSVPTLVEVALAGRDTSTLRFWLVDETDPKAPVVLVSNGEGQPKAYAGNSLLGGAMSLTQFEIHVADRRWAFHVAPTAAYVDAHSSRSPYWMLIGGLLVTAFATGFVLVVSDRQRRLVDSRERDLENQKFALDQHAIVSITDRRGVIVYANDRFCQISGRTRAELIGVSHNVVASGRHDSAFYEQFWNSMLAGSVWHGEICNRNADGDLYWLASTVVPLRDQDGAIDRFIAICTDITARKSLEQELEGSRAFLQSVTDSMGEGVYTIDEEGRCTFLNAEAERLIGWRFEEVRGRLLHEVVHIQDAAGEAGPAVQCAITAALRASRKHHSENHFFMHRDGRIFPVSINAVRLEENGALAGAVIVFQDITERRHVQEELEKSEQRLSVALSASSTGLWDYNPISDEAVYSDTWFRMLGYEPLPERQNGDTFKSLLHPDDHVAYAQALELHVTGAAPAMEIEFRMRRATGEWAWIRSIGKIIERDAKGRPQRLIGVHIDSTAAHLTQQELAGAKDIAIRASQAKSDFLATMSHEIRTPMNAIIGLSHIMGRTEMNARQRDYLTKIQNASQALLAIINDILDFSKIEAGKLNIEAVDFDLEETLEGVTTLINPKIVEKGLTLRVDRAPNLPENFVGDPLRISQVLMNLLSNAAKFTAAGEIRLTLGGHPIADGRFRLEVSVSDTGIGMSESQMASLFRPFTQADASTSRRFGGTGLGLAICRQILTLMDGDVSVHSVEGVGTTFSFQAPLGIGAPMRLAAREAQALDGKRALLVDDSKSSRHILRAELTKLGFVVEEEATAGGALQRLEDAFFDAVLLDWKLPDLDGLDLLDQMLRRGACPPVLMMTAYGADELKSALSDRFGPTPNVRAVLAKPVSQTALKENLLAAFGQVGRNPARLRAGLQASDVILPDVRILLVEDNPINQQVATELLEALGVETTVANSGEEALEILAIREFDLILMDIQMPGKDGLQTTVAIRTELGDTRTPILAMTANAMSGDRERCLEAGMNDHISKPISPDALALTLARWLESAGAMRAPRKETAAPPVAPSWPGIDAAFGLRNLNGNLELLTELLDVFCEEHAEQAEALRKAAAAEDWKKVNAIAHGLKGAASTLGAMTVASLARDIETAARGGDPDRGEIDVWIASLSDALAEVQLGVRAAAEVQPSPAPAAAATPTVKALLPAIDALERLLCEGDADAEGESARLAASLIDTAAASKASAVAASAGRYDFEGASAALAELRAEVAAWV